MDVFRTLMRTRRSKLHPDHVGALNLVEVEFKDETTVITEWRKYWKHLGVDHPKRPEEQATDALTREEKQLRHSKYDNRIGKEGEKLLATLLHAIAKVLDFKIEQLEIFEGGYYPKGWGDIELQQDAIRRFVVGLYLGEYAVPVAVTDYTTPPSDVPDKKRNNEGDNN